MINYYDRFEWLIRTNMRSANDNLIVERRRQSQVTEPFSSGILYDLQYGDKVVIDSIESLSDTPAGFEKEVFTAITTGIDIVNHDGRRSV